MQQLFATNSLPKEVLGNTDKSNKIEPQKKTDNLSNPLEFNTMQNMFATKGF